MPPLAPCPSVRALWIAALSLVGVAALVTPARAANEAAVPVAGEPEPGLKSSWWQRPPTANRDALPTGLTVRAQVPDAWTGVVYADSEVTRGGLTPGVHATLGLPFGLAVNAGAFAGRPTAGLTWRPLDGERVKAAIGGRWKGEGFTEPEGEIEGFAALSVLLPAATELHANAVLGGDPDRNGWDFEAAAAALHHLGSGWQAGVEARGRAGQEKGVNLSDWTAGPSLRIDIGRVAIIGMAGLEVRSGVGPWGLLRIGLH